MEEMRLADARLSEMTSQLPAVHMNLKKNYVRDPDDYICPFYKTPVRAGTLSITGKKQMKNLWLGKPQCTNI